jgi:hypothetical protein
MFSPWVRSRNYINAAVRTVGIETLAEGCSLCAHGDTEKEGDGGEKADHVD